MRCGKAPRRGGRIYLHCGGAVRRAAAAGGRDYLFLSHVSREPGYALAQALLGLSPCLMLDMGLGEGSGCPLAFQILKAACAVMSNMATFQEAAIDDSYLAQLTNP